MLVEIETKGGGESPTRETENLVRDIKGYIADPPQRSIVLDIDPETAAIILSAFNSKNRPFKTPKIRKMADAMAQGNWYVTGDTIKFSKAGILLDGQNRLAASVLSEMPFRTHVVFGIETKAFDRTDIGAPRTATDMLQIIGVKNAANIAHAIGWMERLQNRSKIRGHSGGVAPYDVVRLHRHKYKDLSDHFEWGTRLRQQSGVTASRGLLLHYAFSKLGDKRLAQEFMDAWIDGHSFDKYPQAEALRKQLSKLQVTTPTTVTANVYYATAIRAWNAMVTGRKATKAALTWDKNDPFPVILRPKGGSK